MVLTEGEKNRIRIINENENIQIIVDVHGLKTHEAKRLINNLVVMLRGSFELKIIHGYNHGTSIKEMIWNEFKNKKVVNKLADKSNLGVTYLAVGV